MPRYALKIEYHGAPFFGWQRQKDHPSVQGAIEAALGKLEKNVPTIVAAGRTDAGVHGLAQVAHCDMVQNWDTFRLSEALNHHLRPLPISIIACARVNDDFSARFSATERRYMFRLVNRRARLTHDAGLAWHVRVDLDLEAMRAGADRLLGRHDFTTFRSTSCQADNPVRTLDELRIEKIPYAPGHDIAQGGGREIGQEFRFYIRARAFLHNQIRSFVGSLERVGAGTWTPDDITNALEAQDRMACGPVCPPQGLYFAGVTYPIDPFTSI